MTKNFEKIVEVLSRESLQDALDACTTEADAVKLLAENGVETTESELKDVLIQIMERAHAAYGDSELREEQLEQIAGGYSWSAFRKGFKNIMGDILAGIGSIGMGGVY